MPQSLSKQAIQAQNQLLFTSLAPHYDLMNKIISLGMEPFWKRRAVNCLANVHDEMLVLDLCGGTGDLTSLALRRYHKGYYIVDDLNLNMLAAGKRKIAPNHKNRVLYVQGDAMALPYANEAFDKVMICFGLRNIPNIQGCLNEIARVLKPSGQLVCVEFALPRQTLLRWGYNLYMHTFVRAITTLITRQQATYNYLYSSIMHFAKPEEVMRTIDRAGLSNHRQLRLFCGVCYIYSAFKSC